MATTVNNNNIESNNGMSQVVIDMRPKTRMYEGHGRETLTEVYYRVNVTAYTANLYTYTEQAREESKKACEAYYSEVVALLEAEGWERQNDKYDDCPTMTKGTQQLRCHPQEIVGNVLGKDVERLAEKLKGMTSCKWIGVDVYSNCVITTSAEDTMQLYRQTWDCEIMNIMAEMFRTKRTTMYYKLEARLHNVADRIRIKINDWRNGKVDYKHDEDVTDFDGVRQGGDYVVNVYLREWARLAISEGRLIVTENADGIKIARWVNKKEEKERAKAIREAEKAAKIKETYKTGLLITDTKFGHDYERITGIEEGMNTYIVTTATKIQVECMKHHRVMERAKNEHTVADLPEWVRPGAVLMINGMWKWEEVEIVELADGCVWYKKGNSVMGWAYDHFISLYVNHRYAKVKEYAPEPTLEDIGKFRALCEAEGCTYPGDVEGTREYYRDTLLAAEDGKTVSYQFGNCRFDCKRNESGTWDVHAYDTDGEDTTFEDRTASFFGGMFNDLFKTWGSGNLPEPPAEVHIDVA